MKFNRNLACGNHDGLSARLRLLSAPAAHGARPVWWEQAQAQAQKAGYGLISLAGLQSLLDRNASFILLDVRTPQEFQQGHLPGALNLQFDFGDQAGLTAAKKKALEAITGGDLERSLVIYDRSLQCPRSNIAAGLIAAQGYKKVLRMAPGWLGWQKLHQAGPAAHPEPILPGGVFPGMSSLSCPAATTGPIWAWRPSRRYAPLTRSRRAIFWSACSTNYAWPAKSSLAS